MFSKQSEFLATGLADGIVKLWDLKRRIQLRTFRSNAPYSLNFSQSQAQYNSAPATSICFNPQNSLLACANQKGLISLFPTSDLTSQGGDAAPLTNYTPEICILKQNDQCVHQIEFSAFDKNLLAAAQDDATVTLYDVN